MTLKQRRERRQESKIAKGMERRLLRGRFKQELVDLRFEDIKFQGKHDPAHAGPSRQGMPRGP